MRKWIAIGKKEMNYDILSGLILIMIVMVFFLIDSVNASYYHLTGFDEGYNATVAANVMRHGEYRVSYPGHITFYNMITTGVPVILPTAFVYKVFGISSLTTAIVPIIYGTVCILLFWWILGSCLKKSDEKVYLISAVATAFFVLSDGLYMHITRNLIGESAALFFILLSCLLLFRYFEKGRTRDIFGAGAVMACSFLTKSSMIFFVVTFVGLIVIETYITKDVRKRDCAGYFAGLVAGFGVVDFYKFVQLGGRARYLQWWKDEWSNMLNQSSGIDRAYSIKDKIDYLETIFLGSSKYFVLFLIALPVLIYAYLILVRVMKKCNKKNNGLRIMAMAGVGGSSLLVYFILLGGGGLVYARRQEVNALFVRMFGVYLTCLLLCYIIRVIRGKEECGIKCVRKSILVTVMVCAAVLLMFPWSVVKSNFSSYMEKERDYDVSVGLMDGLLAEINNLPENATLYCAGWWQEPNVTLYLDRDMKNIYDVNNAELAENSYFVVGMLIDGVGIADIENGWNVKLERMENDIMDYSRYDSGEFNNFVIYRMVSN